MDPSSFLHYTSPPGLPQESKLATYLKHNSQTQSVRHITQTMNRMTLEDPNANSRVQIPMPMSKYVFLNQAIPEPTESLPPSRAGLPTPHPQVHQENVGGTTYFVYSTSPDTLNTSHNTSGGIGADATLLGAGPSMSMSNAYAAPMYRAPSLGLNDKSGLEMPCYIYPGHDVSYLPQSRPQQHYPEVALPANVDMFSDLVPLEGPSLHTMTSSYRATHRQSCDFYALRRLHGFYNVSPTVRRLELWKQINHPNIVRFHDYFTTTAFGDHSMVLVYEYHSSCVTLMEKYLSGGGAGAVSDGNGAFLDPFSSDPDAPRPYTHQKNAMLRAVASGAVMPEQELWNLLVQLTAALRVIHTAGLACRTLDPTKVLINGCRVRIAWCGAADAFHANPMDLRQAQEDDLTALGRLTLALACRTIHCDNFDASMDLVEKTYSPDLKNLIVHLLTSSTERRSVADVMPMIGGRFYNQVEMLLRRSDEMEADLARQYDNSRLLRLLIKLGVVNERPELNMDPTWSETGDRYMLKLFRDYLFHSVTPDGRPWLDQAHLVHALNQLDGGTNTRVQLMSRDGRSVLVVTFAELKHCLDQAFEEVMQLSMPRA